MTKEQLTNLAEIGKQIKDVCGDFYGYVRFNLKPGRRDVNINVEQSFIIQDGKELNKTN